MSLSLAGLSFLIVKWVHAGSQLLGLMQVAERKGVQRRKNEVLVVSCQVVSLMGLSKRTAPAPPLP